MKLKEVKENDYFYFYNLDRLLYVTEHDLTYIIANG
jgi:hypothetical protein